MYLFLEILSCNYTVLVTYKVIDPDDEIENERIILHYLGRVS